MKRKNLFNYIFVIFIVCLNFSCHKDFLNRKPLDELTANDYFEDEVELKTYVNSFYSILPSPYDIWESYADNAATVNPSALIKGLRTIPSTGGGWSWTKLRDINFFLNHLNQFQGPVEVKEKYEGAARFFRAWFYFKKIKRFGKVPWYSKVINTDDEDALQKARDPRSVVMDSVLNDLNFAIRHLGNERNVARVTKWTALALKSRIFLYEGTWWKYHGLGSGNEYKKYLEECVKASLNLMQSGEYKIFTHDGNIDLAYYMLFAEKDANPDEYILARLYDASLPVTHDVERYTNTSSFGHPGLTKHFMNSYLMADGTRFTDIPNHNKMKFYDETRNRDPRLYQTIRAPGYTRIGVNGVIVPDFGQTVTGYQFIKFLEPDRHHNTGDDNDLPVFRYAETLLNYAEAKAELGTLTQEDINKSIRHIRDRVGMPNIKMAESNANPDPFLEEQYPNVLGLNKGVILEIRRERRIELVREGFRWDDLMRWKVGPNAARQFKGMYFPGPGQYDLDHNGTIDLVIYIDSAPTKQPGRQYRSLQSMHLESENSGGLMLINPNISKKFQEPKDYLYPIPLQELVLNPNLNQNPGWPSK